MILYMNRVLAQYWLERQFTDKDINQVGGKGKKLWTTLSHNGLLFPAEYVKHNVPLIYDGNPIILDIKSEEVATLYAKYLESDYIKSKVFNKNFWKDFKSYIKNIPIIKEFDKCDFSKIRDHILKEKENQMILSKEEKQQAKERRAKEEEKYRKALIDGKEELVGNFRVEPPGIFIGRGCHPKLGKIKPRIYPEDITINIGKGEVYPTADIEGVKHSWKKVVHNKEVKWLASWLDSISGKTKYVWLGSQSSFKADSDIKKFDLARKLGKKIKSIREVNEDKMVNGNNKEKQISIALYFIENLALRVGNEKGEDEADTVGVTSLRVEHISLGESNTITLDFLGKDSVRYVKKINVNDKVYHNLKSFTDNKDKGDNLFDLIKSNDLNKYLQGFMKNLTAKVFRTFNASHLFQKELSKAGRKYDDEADDINKINMLLDEYNKANAKVALLCNHQKKITGSFNEQISKISKQIKDLKIKYKNETNKDKKSKIIKKINLLKSKKIVKTELKGVSLGTSKTNYIDPRITISFMKKHKIPIDKLFSKALQDKFWWAFDVDENFKF